MRACKTTFHAMQVQSTQMLRILHMSLLCSRFKKSKKFLFARPATRVTRARQGPIEA